MKTSLSCLDMTKVTLVSGSIQTTEVAEISVWPVLMATVCLIAPS